VVHVSQPLAPGLQLAMTIAVGVNLVSGGVTQPLYGCCTSVAGCSWPSGTRDSCLCLLLTRLLPAPAAASLPL
jgi:hypothetical protein